MRFFNKTPVPVIYPPYPTGTKVLVEFHNLQFSRYPNYQEGLVVKTLGSKVEKVLVEFEGDGIPFKEWVHKGRLTFLS
ncbi:hypothetical protein [Caudoviricetes sp.]|nr:hypothetical protein [Caudoviricetes sp.]